MNLSVLALLLTAQLQALELSPLAKGPDWSRLKPFQQTITKERFTKLLDEVYAPNRAATSWIRIGTNSALVHEGQDIVFELLFAAEGKEIRPPRFWRAASELPAATERQPLKGYKIAIDPGHLGGRWAKMEARWFQLGQDTPVTEGDMTLRVARILAKKLRTLGAEVMLVRNSPVPTTAKRPQSLESRAIQSLGDKPPTQEAIRRESERLFYRVSEIRGRAIFVNTSLKPDLTLCLHFNAEDWGNPSQPRLTNVNHFHYLVNGCYTEQELAKADVRFDMLQKLLSGSFEEELALSENLGIATHRSTGLETYHYRNASAVALGEFTWARNLLANRLYNCPVVFAELYVMNSRSFYERVQMGAYHGLHLVEGVQRPNIYEEYADSIATGLRDHFLQKRKKKTAYP